MMNGFPAAKYLPHTVISPMCGVNKYGVATRIAFLCRVHHVRASPRPYIYVCLIELCVKQQHNIPTS